MYAEWQPLEFTPKTWKDTYILDGEAVELLQNTLDTHIIDTQSMKGSSHAKHFDKEIAIWEEQLVLTQEILDVWVQLQSSWVYLEPVFSSEDITR